MKGTPTDAAIDALLAKLDTAFTPGVAALVTTSPSPTSFQVGSDATPICAAVGRLIDNIKVLPTKFPGLALPIDTALADPECFWVHPVERSMDNPARAYLRRMSNDYDGFTLTLSPAKPRDHVLTRAKRRAASGFFRLVTKPVKGADGAQVVSPEFAVDMPAAGKSR